MISAMAAEVETTAVCIPIGDHRWNDADVTVPPEARGVVVFAHGSASRRHSPRNRADPPHRRRQRPRRVSLNELAVRRMKGKGLLQIIPGATHLFEEPGALEQVGALASQWFVKHLH